VATQEQLLRKLAKQNLSQSRMAAELGISTDTLRLRLRELKLISKKGKRLSLDAVKAAYDKAGSSAGAAEILGISRQAVHSRLAAAGIITVAKREEQPS
jgi:DNA-binding NtrC family response regulator